MGERFIIRYFVYCVKTTEIHLHKHTQTLRIMELHCILFLHTYEHTDSLSLPWHAVTMKQIVFCDGSAWVLASLTSLGCLPSGSPITAFRYTALQSETAQNANKSVIKYFPPMLSSKVNNLINNIEIEMLDLFIYGYRNWPQCKRVLLMLTKTKIIKNHFVNLK